MVFGWNSLAAAVCGGAWAASAQAPIPLEFNRFLPKGPARCGTSSTTLSLSNIGSLFDCQEECIADPDCTSVIYKPRCPQGCEDNECGQSVCRTHCPLDCNGEGSDLICELVTSSPCTKNGRRTYVRETVTGESCGEREYDLIFVMDESGSIEFDNYQKLKQFVVDVASTIRHNKEKVFEASTTIEFGTVVNNIEPHGTDPQVLEREVSELGFFEGGTNTEQALLEALNQRQLVPNKRVIVILLTDGKPTVFGPNAQDDSALAISRARDAARQLTAVPNTNLIYASIQDAQADLFDGINDVETFIIEDFNLDEVVVGLEGLIESAVCITESPTRSPTKRPTSDRPTLSPTRSPTTKPTDSPTTLPPSTCTVRDFQELSVDFPSGADLNTVRNQFVVSAGARVESANQILLTDGTRTSAAHTVFYRVQQNLVGGFIADFDIEVDDESFDQGFAFVIQRAGINDIPPSTGSGLGFSNIPNSVSVVFDLCTNRNTRSDKCLEQLSSFRYKPASGFAAPTTDTLRFAFTRSNEYSVRVEYLEQGERIRVYLGEKMILEQLGFRIESIIGGVDAFLGFTTATARQPLQHRITKFEVTTVPIVDQKSRGVDFNQPPKELFADGKSTAGFSLQLIDFCDTEIKYGGAPEKIHAVFIELVDEETGLYSGASSGQRLRALQDETVDPSKLVPHVVRAVIQDNNDGTYTAAMSTDTENVTYSMFASVGDQESCEPIVSLNGDPGTLQTASVTVRNRNNCFFDSVPKAIDAVPPPEFVDPDGAGRNEGEETNLAMILLAGGAASAAFIFAAMAATRYRKRWQEDKGFIDQGKMYKLEQNVGYADDAELTALHGSVLATRQAILREKSQMGKQSKEGEIAKLERERKDLRSMVRKNKKDVQQLGVRTSFNPRHTNIKKEFGAVPPGN